MLKTNSQILCILGVSILFLVLITYGKASNNYFLHNTGVYFLPDSVAADSVARDTLETGPYQPSKKPIYQPKDRFGDPFSHSTSPSPLQLKDPSSLKMDVEIDTGMNYTIYEKIGDVNYRPTSSMTFEEFNEYQERQIIRNYWKNRSAALDGESAVSGRNLIPRIYFSPVFDRIFGGSYLDLQRNGFVTLDFGARFDRSFNPSIPIRQQRNGGFEFDQQISMNVVGKIGEKLAVTANFDNNNTFDFEN
ncbi:MAG: cell surface protein SprA, partial [Bacteroidetes bacterium]|nr:cell surface protein SprA [Bacteroidota bacterium]